MKVLVFFVFVAASVFSLSLAAESTAKKQRFGETTIEYPEYPAHPPGRTRFFHTSLRVSDLDRSVAFYRDVLGFKEIRTHELGLQRMSFMTTGDGEPILELVENKKANPEEIGVNFGHLGVFVGDVKSFYEKSKANGDKWTMRPMRFDPAAPLFGFITDPDGYRIEVMENPRPSDCTSCHRSPHLK